MSDSEPKSLFVPLRKLTRLPPVQPYTPPPPMGLIPRVPLIVLWFLGGFLLVLHSAFYAQIAAEPALVSLRCAEQFARLGTLQFNPGGERVEAFANLLWTLQLGIAAKLHFHLLAAAKALGIASALALLAFTLYLVRWLMRRLGAGAFPEFVTGLLACALLATSPVLAAATQSGFETAQFALLVAVAFGGVAVAGQSGFRRWRAISAGAIVLVILSRPEGIVYYAVWVAAWYLQHGNEPAAAAGRPRPLRRWLWLPLGAWLLLTTWRWMIFGKPLPYGLASHFVQGLSFETLAHGWHYFQLFYTFHSRGWIYLFFIPGLLLIMMPGFGLPLVLIRFVMGVLLAGVPALAVAIAAGGEAQGYSRLLAPLLLVNTLVPAWLAGFYLHQSRVAEPNLRWPARIPFILVCVASLIISGRQMANQYHGLDAVTGEQIIATKPAWWRTAWERLANGEIISFSPYANTYTSGLAPLALEGFAPGAKAVMPDVGQIGAVLPDVTLIQNTGYASPAFARFLRRRAKTGQEQAARAELFAWLNAQRPEWLLLPAEGPDGPMLAAQLRAADWPAFANTYDQVTTLNEYGGPLNLDLMRRIQVFRRRGVWTAPAAAEISAHYAALGQLFPRSAEVRELQANWARRAPVFVPFQIESVNAQNAPGNRVRLKQTTLAGIQFLGRFDTLNALDDWRMQGTAFQDEPRIDPVFGQQPPSDFVGQGYLNSFHSAKRESASGQADSPPFVPQAGQYLLFWLAGGSSPRTGIDLLIAGQSVMHWSGYGHNRLTPVLVDLARYAGQPASIRIVDEAKDTNGWVIADQFVLLRASAAAGQ